MSNPILMGEAVRVVDCECDACGAASSCGLDEPAPRGWYFIHALGPDAFKAGGGILACSTKCKERLEWRRAKGPR